MTPTSVAVAEPYADDVAGLQVDRHVDDLRVGRRGQVCWRRDRSDISRHLADAYIEGEVRMLALGHAHGVVQRGGNVSLAGHQRNAVGRIRAKALRCARLLRKAHRGHGYDSVGDGQRNAESAEEPSAEAGALTADAEDGGIGGLPAEVREERNRLFGPGFGDGYVDVAIGVRLGSRDGNRGAQTGLKAVLIVELHGNHAGLASDKLVPGAHYATNRHTWRPWTELSIVDSHDLAVKDIHAACVPKLAKIRRDRH